MSEYLTKYLLLKIFYVFAYCFYPNTIVIFIENIRILIFAFLPVRIHGIPIPAQATLNIVSFCKGEVKGISLVVICVVAKVLLPAWHKRISRADSDAALWTA